MHPAANAASNASHGLRPLLIITKHIAIPRGNVPSTDKSVNQIMECYVGIVRSNLRLTRAWNRLDILYEETESLFKRCKASREICELRNMINVGYLITRQAMERKESRGLHYTIDYPHKKE